MHIFYVQIVLYSVIIIGVSAARNLSANLLMTPNESGQISLSAKLRDGSSLAYGELEGFVCSISVHMDLLIVSVTHKYERKRYQA